MGRSENGREIQREVRRVGSGRERGVNTEEGGREWREQFGRGRKGVSRVGRDKERGSEKSKER